MLGSGAASKSSCGTVPSTQPRELSLSSRAASRRGPVSVCCCVAGDRPRHGPRLQPQSPCIPYSHPHIPRAVISSVSAPATKPVRHGPNLHRLHSLCTQDKANKHSAALCLEPPPSPGADWPRCCGRFRSSSSCSEPQPPRALPERKRDLPLHTPQQNTT